MWEFQTLETTNYWRIILLIWESKLNRPTGAADTFEPWMKFDQKCDFYPKTGLNQNGLNNKNEMQFL